MSEKFWARAGENEAKRMIARHIAGKVGDLQDMARGSIARTGWDFGC